LCFLPAHNLCERSDSRPERPAVIAAATATMDLQEWLTHRKEFCLKKGKHIAV
jgi:hypothetical protein